MYSKKNPYDHRQPASEEVFVGRNSLVNQLASGLRSGHSYGLTGDAGLGKTSLLFAIKRKLTSRRFKGVIPVPIYIRIDKSYLTHASVILETILASFIDALVDQYDIVVADRETLLEEARRGQLQEAVRVLSNLYHKQKLRLCRLVLLIDDLHRGLGSDVLSEVISILRPLVSPNDTSINVSLVLSGELPLEQEFRNDVSSLRGLLSDTLELTPLPLNDVVALVELARDYDWSVEPGCEERVFTLTEGVPFKIHSYLFTALDRHKEISRSVLQTLSQDQRFQNRLATMLKQTPIVARQDTITHPVFQKQTPGNPIQVFFSYAQEDEQLAEKLNEQLVTLKRRNLITDWQTGKVDLGKNINEEIINHLHKADIILLLISASFLVSQYEIISALEQYNLHKKVVVPVLLRPTADWQSIFLDKLQLLSIPFLPRNGLAITLWANQDAAFADVAEEIIQIVKKWKQ